MLEGKELEGKIGDVGGYSVDVNEKGEIKISLDASKDLGYLKASSSNSIETNIFKLAEEIAKKTKTDLDDKAIAGLKLILGIKDLVDAVPAPAPAEAVQS